MNQLLRITFWGACMAVAVLSMQRLEAWSLPPIRVWDKAQHASAFFALGVIGLLAYRSRPLVVLAGLIVFGAAIELAQSLTGWRQGDWQDWVADAVGLALAYGAWGIWQFKRRVGPG